MERVTTYFSDLFDQESSSEFSENEENRKTNSTKKGNGSEKNKKAKFQSSNYIFSQSITHNGSNRSTESLPESQSLYSESEWLQILKVNDLNFTPHLQLLASLRGGIPEKL